MKRSDNLEAFFQELPDLFVVVDQENVCLFANQRAENTFAGPESPVVGSVFPLPLAVHQGELLESVTRDGSEVVFMVRSVAVEWHGVQAYAALLVEVTPFISMAPRFSSHEDALFEILADGIDHLFEGGKIIDDFEKVLHLCCQRSSAEVSFLAVIDRSDQGQISQIRHLAAWRQGDPRFSTLSTPWDPLPPDRVPFLRDLLEHNIVQVHQKNLPRSWRFVAGNRRVRSGICVPIIVDDTVWGILAALETRYDRVWTEGESSFMRSLSLIISRLLVYKEQFTLLNGIHVQNQALMDVLADEIFYVDVSGNVLSPYGEIGDLPDTTFPHPGMRISDADLPRVMKERLKIAVMRAVHLGEPQQFQYTTELRSGKVNRDVRVVRIDEKKAMVIDRDVTERGEALQNLRESGDMLKHLLAQLEQKNHETSLLSRMNEYLQICVQLDQLYAVIAEFGEKLFPQTTGRLYMREQHNLAKDILFLSAEWGQKTKEEVKTINSDCLVQVYADSITSDQVGRYDRTQCKDCFGSDRPFNCYPIFAQTDFDERPIVVGVLSIWNDKNDVPLSGSQKQLMDTMTEQVGLRLSNFFLREMLREQAVRDPLTNLFNRRYLFETLEREMSRVQREKDLLISVLLMDMDHFKNVNDTYGHAAGDAALVHLAELMQTSVRGSDIACRYGGEEFILVLIGSGEANGLNRAEQIAQAVRTMKVPIKGGYLSGLTVSIGVAIFPVHASTLDDILMAADKAMYRAKAEGRDQVRIAENFT